MIIKRIGKLKQQKGAVLFTVIAIMTLLIAMASTAYYTARGAHNTVVSNYNYSQLYISAVSVADMISESVINDTAINATSTNNFKPLKEALANLNTPGSSVMAYSPNITDATKSNSEIINQLANSGNSIIDGTLDGITIKIELPANGVTYRNYADGTDDSNNPVRFHYYDYTYVFTTTAFYNGNSITVEDYLTTVKVKKSTGKPGTPGAPDTPGTPGTPSNNNVNFSTFFTATGQDFNADGGYGKANRVVKIGTDEISDDAFFENTYTFFNNGRDNNFKGGITASGSVYLNKFSCDGIADSDDNDWFIGDDLVIGDNNSNNLNLGSQNNLYVGRDLVLACNANVTAGDIYVEGDLYIIGQVKINGNLHVSGNIIYELADDSEVVTVAKSLNNGQKIAQKDGNVLNNGWTVEGSLDVNGNIILPAGSSEDTTAKIIVYEPIKQENKLTAGSASTSANNIGTYLSSNTMVTVSNRVADDENNVFISEESDPMSVKDAIALKTDTNNVYANYTSAQTAYNNKANLDLSQLDEVKDKDGKLTGYEGTFIVKDSEGVEHNIEVVANCESPGSTTVKDATIKIPYIEEGILLDIDAEQMFKIIDPNAEIKYEIGEGSPKGKTMSVVLADNTTVTEGEGEKKTTTRAFSWRGNNYDAGSGWTDVSIMGEGNVTFEMANYSLDEPDKYIPYNPNDYKNIGTVNYVAAQKEVVGTKAQVDYIDNNENNKTSGMLNTGTSVPKEEYQNRIMLVSNSRGSKAINYDRQNNIFCGYVYAPNGEFFAGDNTNSNVPPIFGGMIVSTYEAKKTDYVYAEPKPSLISEMLGSLVGSQIGSTGGTEGTPDIPGKPATPVTPPSDSTVTWAGTEGMYGYEWQYQGTNYLG